MDPRKFTERLPGTPDQVRKVRRIITALGDSHPCVEDAVLLASETATNAVQHSDSARQGGEFALTVEHTDIWTLGKCGIPVQVRRDGDQHPYARASHPKTPLSTDVYCVREEGGAWCFRSEWGSVIGPADDVLTVIDYVVSVLRVPPA